MSEILKFREITLKIGSGSTPTGGSESYKEFGTSLIRSMNVYDFNFKKNGLAFIDEIQAKKLNNVTVEEDDILLNITGASVARCCMVPNEILPARVNQHVSIIRIDKNKAVPKYVLFYINSPSYKNYILGLSASGATREALTKEVIENLTIPLPPLHSQQKIASILSSYDELIENNKQRIQLLVEMEEEIYKEWFVRLRFPGYETSKINDGLPEGWKKGNIKNYLDFYIGGGWGEDSPNGNNETPAYVIRGTDIPNAKIGDLNFNILRYHSISNLSSRKLQINDIVFEVSGGTESQSLGRTLLVTKSLLDRFDNDVICASFCKLIRVKSEISSGIFIFSLLNRLYKTEEIALYQVQSTGISNYKFEDFIEKHKITIPDFNLQLKFEKIVQPMLDEIQLLGSKNKLLQETRDLLLPRLISGQLSVAHLVVEELGMVAEERAEYNKTVK